MRSLPFLNYRYTLQVPRFHLYQQLQQPQQASSSDACTIVGGMVTAAVIGIAVANTHTCASHPASATPSATMVSNNTSTAESYPGLLTSSAASDANNDHAVCDIEVSKEESNS